MYCLLYKQGEVFLTYINVYLVSAATQAISFHVSYKPLCRIISVERTLIDINMASITAVLTENFLKLSIPTETSALTSC
jgi:hypothetical protein